MGITVDSITVLVEQVLAMLLLPNQILSKCFYFMTYRPFNAVLPQEEGTAASRGPVNTFILQGPVPVVPDSHGTQPFGSSTSSTGSFPTSYPHEDQNFAVM